MKITQIEKAIISFIVDYYGKSQFYPSYDEIVEGNMERLTNSGTKEAKSDVTIREALNKLADYEDLEERLNSVYGDCDGLLETIVEFLVRHQGVNISETVLKARLLSDETVDKWEEYKTLEEQGKLLKLPCAVGDTVYIVSRGKILPIKVLGFQIFLLEGELVMQIKCADEVSYGYMHFLTKEIGKTVFLKSEEAEAALKEISGVAE